MGEYTEASVVDFALAVEEDFRVAAVELSRGEEQLPWGVAITQARKENSDRWQERRDLLQASKAPASAARDAGDRSFLGASSGAGAKCPASKQLAARKHWKTSPVNGVGWKVCKK